MLKLVSGFEHDTVAVVASGIVSGEDYEQLLLPVIESKLHDHASIRFWYEFSHDFKGITVSALWDDALLGLFHLSDFSKIAIVVDDKLMAAMAHTLACMVPCPAKVFGLQEYDIAKQWFDTP